MIFKNIKFHNRNRCRGVREDESAVKTHDCVFPNRPNL